MSKENKKEIDQEAASASNPLEKIVMKHDFQIESVMGIHKSFFPMVGQMTIRGYGRGNKATTAQCDSCGDIIVVGEQYFNLYEELEGIFCLGCVVYT